MRSTALLLLTLCCSTIVGMTQSKRASADEKAMIAVAAKRLDESLAMKAFGGKLSDSDIKALVAYVRTLKK